MQPCSTSNCSWTPKYDLFERFTKEELEKIACTLGSVIASKIPDFYSMDSLKEDSRRDPERTLVQAIRSNAPKINIEKKRNLYFVVSLIDGPPTSKA